MNKQILIVGCINRTFVLTFTGHDTYVTTPTQELTSLAVANTFLLLLTNSFKNMAKSFNHKDNNTSYLRCYSHYSQSPTVLFRGLWSKPVIFPNMFNLQGLAKY
jgi:hypothetical protein